jgi:transcriptional regulator with XRE-family HTH domain
MHRRELLDPPDLGLPRTGRRRVPGLRRGEVAELVGVSVEWYRFFESGRSVRVSPQFVARLSRALRLSAAHEATLFRLALPELYRFELLAG